MFALLAAVEADHPSKTPFYIAGALLVVFALAVSAIGARSETFPPTRAARIGVTAVAFLLVAAAMLSAVLTS
jgi:O-acetyl-ADP-ribose deacetylase (regulator of RNase III)